MDEGRTEPAEEGHDHAIDLLRIESKLDLLTDLIAQLLDRNHPPAPEHLVRISIDSVIWEQKGDPSLQAGQWLRLSLRIDLRLPRPLVLPARVAAVDRTETGYRVQASLAGMGEVESDLLEKYLFRQHRKEVAQLRAKRQN